LILHGRIKTTKAKAQALRPELERLMTLVKKGELSSQRAALARLGNDKEAVNLLFSKYTELVRSRNSGFVKIQLLAQRRGDAAEMVEISWVNFEDKDENVSNKTKRS
jgi:large subunit ribosomal protein L17